MVNVKMVNVNFFLKKKKKKKYFESHESERRDISQNFLTCFCHLISTEGSRLE
jgi:hypothetical protein